MAVVQLSDVFVAPVYAGYSSINDPEKSALVRSGIVADSPVIREIARGGGKLSTIPFWKDLDPTIEPNYSNDDPADLAVPNKIGTGTMTGRKAWLNQSYSAMDLVSELINENPMQRIRDRFGVYWTRQMERRIIAMCQGILADNIANDSGDMLTNISGLTGADAVFGSSAFITAAYQVGDAVGDMWRAIAVHSAVMQRMVLNDEIVYMPDSQGALTIPTYKGKVVIVTDMMPVPSAGVYDSILFGSSAFGFGGLGGAFFAMGEGLPAVPAEVYRVPQAGSGGGQEAIIERKTWMIHPGGFEWVEGGAALAEFSPTLADLRLAAHWNRVVSRKQVPIAFIRAKVA